MLLKDFDFLFGCTAGLQGSRSWQQRRAQERRFSQSLAVAAQLGLQPSQRCSWRCQPVPLAQSQASGSCLRSGSRRTQMHQHPQIAAAACRHW